MKSATSAVDYKEVERRLREEFSKLLVDLQYEVDTDLGFRKKKGGDDMFEALSKKMIDLAQTLSAQRAIFEVHVPRKDFKTANDDLVTNVGEPNGDEEEQEGYVQFVIQPALVKKGTEMGYKLNQERIILVRAFVKLL